MNSPSSSPSAARTASRGDRWHQRWDVWVLGSMAMVVLLGILTWLLFGQCCVWMWDGTVSELRAAGYSTTRNEETEALSRRWRAEREAHPVVRHVSARLCLFGIRVATLSFYEPILNMQSPPDIDPISSSRGFSTNQDIVAVEQPARTALSILGSRVRNWSYNGKMVNGEVLLPKTYGYRVALLWRQLLAMDGPDIESAERYVTDDALNLHIIVFILIYRPDLAQDACLEIMRRPALPMEQKCSLSLAHLQTLALLMRVGLLQQEHFVNLRAMALTVTADDVRRSARGMMRQQMRNLISLSASYRKYDGRLFWDMTHRMWAKPRDIIQIFNIRCVLPFQYLLVDMRDAIKELAVYEAQLAAQYGQPGISLPQQAKTSPFRLNASLTYGTSFAMFHNIRLALLDFGLWRARHPGRMPVSLNDFLTAETRAAFITVPGTALEYQQELPGSPKSRTYLRYIVDRSIAPTIQAPPPVLIFKAGDDS
ncbi:MAG: hypothetical protein ACAI35_03135 [Candidatus Methylacidiphilales bacterium]|nr:hypothetical protein [Candidatus Methylacidiphilales bacterium]